MQPLPHPVVDLHEHRRRHDERFVGLLDQASARPVIGISPVHGSVERPGIEN